jgi:hypothetical protein
VVGTDCGSHTHTVVPDPANNRVLIYVSSSAPGSVYGEIVFGNECTAEHGKFQIVAVPLDDPASASVIRDVPLGPAAGQEVSTDCHDIGVLWNGSTATPPAPVSAPSSGTSPTRMTRSSCVTSRRRP